jgi:membrane protease YdiL (CAAX protease family)
MTTLTAPHPITGPAAPAPGPVAITQYRRRTIYAIWAAAAVPMGLLAWVVAPAIADGNDARSLVGPLLGCLTAGMIWQFVLVAVLVGREQRTLRWSVVRDALWLRAPTSPRTGRVGGRLWLLVLPMALGAGLEELASLSPPVNRHFGEFLSSDAGEAMFAGSWGWFGLVVTMFVFNTVLGEELLWRGLLLPRMNGAFGDRDWIANGLLFATYHLHMPWVIPGSLFDMFLYARPAKRHRSALLSMGAHSFQTVMFTALLLTVVL